MTSSRTKKYFSSERLQCIHRWTLECLRALIFGCVQHKISHVELSGDIEFIHLFIEHSQQYSTDIFSVFLEFDAMTVRFAVDVMSLNVSVISHFRTATQRYSPHILMHIIIVPIIIIIILCNSIMARRRRWWWLYPRHSIISHIATYCGDNKCVRIYPLAPVVIYS